MTKDELLDEIEQYLAGHGKINGVQFSECGYLHRIQAVREEIARQAAKAAPEGLHINPEAYVPQLVTGLDIIPEITDELGKHWDQPDRCDIQVRDGNAYMSVASFTRLHSYDASFPSGVYPGKMWKRQNSGIAWLCWYAKEINGRCAIERLRIEVVSTQEYQHEQR